jgi:hypothetical protein
MDTTTPTVLPLPLKGLDVVSQEGALPPNTVRRAVNLAIDNNGSFTQRAGAQLRDAVSGAHSIWTSAGGVTLFAAGDTLYDFDGQAHSARFTGLLPDEPVEYCDAGGAVFFTSRGVLGKITAAGLVRRPGVADLTGMRATLTPTVGGLAKGSYGVAYSLVNDLGEESGLSSIAWLELPNGGGILVTDLVQASNAITLNVYVTSPGGSELYLARSMAWAPSTSLTDQRLGRQATKTYRRPMPWGEFTGFHHGRLWTATGKYAFHSDPFDLGVNSVKDGWLMFARNVTMFQPVEGGIFVGMADRVMFLRGADPTEMRVEVASERGAQAHTGGRIPADALPGEVVAGQQPHAVWLSDIGLMVGRPDGQVIPAQSARIRLDAAGGRVGFVQQSGISHIVFPVESMTMGVGGATDVTL